MRTSSASVARARRALSNSMLTSATLTLRRVAEPLKMTSVISPPRRLRADCSPSTQRTASTTLDLPDPLGPMIPVTPSAKSNSVLSANDLKPTSSRRLSMLGYSDCLSFRAFRAAPGPLTANPSPPEYRERGGPEPHSLRPAVGCGQADLIKRRRAAEILAGRPHLAEVLPGL